MSRYDVDELRFRAWKTIYYGVLKAPDNMDLNNEIDRKADAILARMMGTAGYIEIVDITDPDKLALLESLGGENGYTIYKAWAARHD